MKTLEIGKLYVCPGWHLLVFPTGERAAAAAATWAAVAVGATPARAAYYWSKKLNCHVSWIPAGRVFCVVEEMGGEETRDYHQVHVIAGEAMGWINVPESNWTNVKELKS